MRARKAKSSGTHGSDRLFARAGLYVREIRSRNGFFAQLSALMTLLRVCERRRLRPRIILSSPNYRDPRRGRSFLDYFFHGPRYTLRQRLLLRCLPVRRVTEFDDLPEWSRDDHPGLEESGALFHRHYALAPEFAVRVDEYVRTHFPPGATLGVHWRGTDKQIEATAIDPGRSADMIRGCLRRHAELKRVFVATDSRPYLAALQRVMPDVPILYREHEERSDTPHAVHLRRSLDPYRKGEEALLNALLLSRCSVLLKTMSNLSGWAKVFNPRLPVYLMNRPAGPGIEWLGFPEREMVQRGWFAPEAAGDVDPGAG